MGSRNLEKTVKILAFKKNVFSLISQPPYTFFNFCFLLSLCVLCGNLEYNSPTFKKKLFSNKNCVFVHFSKRRWTSEIIFVINMSYFCVLHPFLSVTDQVEAQSKPIPSLSNWCQLVTLYCLSLGK